MVGKINVPEIRFAGFTDPWEQRKLGDVATITRGERFTAADYVKSDGIPCIHYGEIYTDYGTVATKTISQVKPSLRSSLRYAKPGDVIVATTSENVEDVCKAVAWIGNSPVAYHDDSFALTFSGDPVFLVSFFETSGFYAQKSSVAHGVKVMRVSSDSLANINLPTPLVVEQRLIGSYFSRLDFLITLHQRKYDKLCTVKKSMLDKMFPKPGETEPEIRFEGFTDPWEQRKLGEVAPLQRGFDLPVNQMTPGPYPVVMSNGIGGWHSKYMVKGPGVVTGRSGTIGSLHYIEQNFWPHNTSLWVTSFNGNEPRFIYWLYASLDLERFGSGSGVPTLNRNDVHDLRVRFPCDVVEQRRIGTFFSRLDHLITLHQRKLELLRNIKKSLLNRMFV